MPAAQAVSLPAPGTGSTGTSATANGLVKNVAVFVGLTANRLRSVMTDAEEASALRTIARPAAKVKWVGFIFPFLVVCFSPKDRGSTASMAIWPRAEFEGLAPPNEGSEKLR